MEEYSENGSDINYEEVPNISWIDKNQAYQNNKNLPRLRDFENVPTPYLTGVFDELIKKILKKDGLQAGRQIEAVHSHVHFVIGDPQQRAKYQECI